jgi:site-specific recombinase
MRVDDFAQTFALQGTPADGEWLRHCVRMLRPRRGQDGSQLLEQFLTTLETMPDMQAQLQNAFWTFLESNPARSLLAEGDMHLEHSLLASLITRCLGKVLPPAPRPGWLQDEVRRALDRSSDAAWLESLDEVVVARAVNLFTPPEGHPLHQGLRAEVIGALDIVAHRLAGQGLDREVLRQAPELHKQLNPFLEQAREVDRMMLERDQDDVHLQVLLNQCQEVVLRVRRRARRDGTSMQLTYTLVAAEQSIARLRTLLNMALGRLDERQRGRFMIDLCLGETRRHSVSDLMRHHLSLMALRVTHHAGETGSHYIAENRSQLVKLFLSAAGAGGMVAAMAMVKLEIAALHLPLFVQGFFYGLNYALGFVLIHLMGCTVATKQPAMTAAALAATLSEDWSGRGTPDLRGIADKCVHTMRSQSVAILGNVLLSLPVAVLISWMWYAQFGVPTAGSEKATHLLEELDPIHSLALFHAALAGVGLFLSGLFSGYVDNNAAYYGIADRLRHSPPLRRLLGKRVEVWAGYANHESGALAGNIFLGFYLGMLSAFGQVLGLPLDIRHVSFAAANLGYAWHSLHPAWSVLLYSMLGVALIGAVNLLVSFGLALALAIRARGLGRLALLKVGGQLWSRLRGRPQPPAAPRQPILSD